MLCPGSLTVMEYTTGNTLHRCINIAHVKCKILTVFMFVMWCIYSIKQLDYIHSNHTNHNLCFQCYLKLESNYWKSAMCRKKWLLTHSILYIDEVHATVFYDDDFVVYVLFNIILVISRRWRNDDERLRAVMSWILPSVGFEPGTSWYEVWGATHSANRTLLAVLSLS